MVENRIEMAGWKTNLFSSRVMMAKMVADNASIKCDTQARESGACIRLKLCCMLPAVVALVGRCQIGL